MFMDYHFLFEIAVILLSTKVLGILTKRFALPQVVGALLAGLLLGPAMLGVLQETTLMDQLAELGVIVLMFNAGLETDLGELKRSGKAAFVIALIGVLVPLAGGFALAAAFNRGPDAFLQNVFIGVVLTATSVSITVETLKEIGRLSTRSGSAILGAAIIDDVLGIIGLTVITSLGGGGANVWVVLGKIAAFFAVSVVVWMVMHRFVDWWFRRYSRDKRRFVVLSFAFCLLYSFFAEAVFGVADITGAYIAGLIFANTCRVAYLQDRFDTLSYSLLSPIFFASIGLKVVLPEMSTTILLFAVLLVLWAVVSKVVGCGLGCQAVPLLQPGRPAHRRGHDLPRRGGPDRGQQRHCRRTDEGGVLRPGGADGHRHHHPHPGPAQAGLPRQRARLQRSAGERAGQRLRGRRRLRPGLPGSAGGSREPEAIRQEKITV